MIGIKLDNFLIKGKITQFRISHKQLTRFPAMYTGEIESVGHLGSR